MSVWSELGPRQWHEFVNKEVCVTARDQHSYTGHVFTVDPVSASVVLVSPAGPERPSVTMVLGHAVQEVQVLSAGTEEALSCMKHLFTPGHTATFSAEELGARRESLCAWLQKNRVPVHEEGEMLRVADTLTINAPYGPGDCTCNNEIILARVQSLIQSHSTHDLEK
ncbi:hypothetical protein DNTS_032575 [Danionella cerebrum]|uniref:Gem-associated protein 6 n=1 Tax=Danionella cerebrum TaxID=2873325 RepID=A0A553PY68_9TELE|nr:hypothetical protein DNTS_032575 [Danionella translucida]